MLHKKYFIISKLLNLLPFLVIEVMKSLVLTFANIEYLEDLGQIMSSKDGTTISPVSHVLPQCDLPTLLSRTVAYFSIPVALSWPHDYFG